MTTLDQMILDRLTELDRGYGGAGATARAALRAVLEIHRHGEIPRLTIAGRPARKCAECGTCRFGSYWCYTVTVIASSLGVQS